MSIPCLQGEALVGMLAQLGRLCSAGVGQLMDARDAHDTHAGCLKDAARVAVTLSRQEEALASMEGRWVGCCSVLEFLSQSRPSSRLRAPMT